MTDSTADYPLLTPKLMAKLERMELVSRKVFRGRMKGERRSQRKGQSVEFADFRNYVPGDDLRFIDWNLFARLDRLFLKIFLEEEDLHLYLVIDDSQSMDFGQPSKLTFAKQIAAGLSYIGLCQGDRISISTINQQPAQVYRGRAQLPRLLQQLCDVSPVRESRSFNDAIRSFCVRTAHKGIVVLFSDLLDKKGYEEGLRMLVARNLDIFLVHVLAPEELNPKLVGDLKLVDSEDSDAREVSISPSLLSRYQQTLHQFVGSIKSFCKQRSIAYVPGSSDQPVDRLFESYLQMRGLVR